VETDAPLAPPVVAVVVVHSPGPWFEATLGSLADQDYPNLNTLFLLTGGPLDAAGDDLQARITRRLPDAFVRDLGANPGYGAAANEVLRLVEGDSGFFCFCHDDVALEPDTIRVLVEELYRSNAGIVGPKLVTWEEPSVLQHVGLGLDRFGELDPITEPGEYDQEQHDAVTDVFVIRRPASSCGPTCSAPSAASIRPSRSTATTSTCAGASTSAVRVWSSPPRPGCATGRSWRSAGPTCTTTSCGPGTGCAPSPR